MEPTVDLMATSVDEMITRAEARIEEQRQHMAATHPSRRKWEVNALDQAIKNLEQLTRYRERLITERRAGSH